MRTLINLIIAAMAVIAWLLFVDGIIEAWENIAVVTDALASIPAMK